MSRMLTTISYPMGAWINNSPAGIRAYPYSTSLSTNPHVYTDANGMTSVHAIGTIWASMLYEGTGMILSHLSPFPTPIPPLPPKKELKKKIYFLFFIFGKKENVDVSAS